jgi:hypothetical protein
MASPHTKTKNAGADHSKSMTDLPLDEIDRLIAKIRDKQPDLSGYISVKELAAKLNLDSETIRKFSKTKIGTIKVRSGSKLTTYITKQDAIEFINARKERGLRI